MPIRAWWDGDEDERYWMEITDRSDVGVDIWAPQHSDTGSEVWSYSLVEYVREGDIVFHWMKRPDDESALIGWSRAVGELDTTGTIEWLARGTAGRARGVATKLPSFRLPLEGFTEINPPITLSDLRRVETALVREHDDLADAFGRPLYFPFAFSDTRPLRATQGYLTKFPAGLVSAIPRLAAAVAPGAGRNAPERVAATGDPAETDGRINDPALRRAIERHAVARAMGYLDELGYIYEDVGAIRPYDIEALSDEGILHVEVKGSITQRLTVELTEGEVEHAAGETPTLLVVVDGISWSRDSDGEIVSDGGRLRTWWNWVPDADDLVPIRYRYLLPEQ